MTLSVRLVLPPYISVPILVAVKQNTLQTAIIFFMVFCKILRILRFFIDALQEVLLNFA